MLVLQDFEALTPNLLARTIETVEGGGIVCLLLKDLKSLKQVYNMTMVCSESMYVDLSQLIFELQDVHSRYRTEAHTDVQPRFNERFILSLGSCPNCLFLDDELNVLPISEGKNIKYDEKTGPSAKLMLANEELSKLKEQLKETKTLGPLSKLCATTDQLKALLTFWSKGEMDKKSLANTISLTAGRGRGKSAALGLALAAAIKAEYHNIFVTSPTPENLKTLFEFVVKGLNALGYEETTDYEIVRSNNEEWGRAVVRITVQREKTRQFIQVSSGARSCTCCTDTLLQQYIQPQDAYVLGQAELLVIDEAAAIPLPLVRKLLGPYLTFMASTVNGYEGTGRSLSIKLLNQLREQSRAAITQTGTADGNAVASSSSTLPVAGGRGGAGLARILSEVKLDQPIRYGQGDPVEKWLNGLLCLDVSSVSRSISGCPHPSQCELYYVNRDTLFSYHPASELFLQRMMSLYVASHYKNTPNDLQLMSDAPAHHLFVLLPPLKGDESTLPDPLVVIQVALEGNISRASVMAQLAKGVRSGGDLIPWLMSQQFQDDDFASLSGARVVRIATHPDYARMGYGKRALESLSSFYSGDLLNLDEVHDEEMVESFAEASRVDKVC
jgi:N-acetyltransferase 10